MDFNKRKIKAAQKLLATEQEEVLEHVEYLLSIKQPIKVSDEQKRLLEEAFKSLEEEGRIPHQQVVQETNKRYNKK